MVVMAWWLLGIIAAVCWMLSHKVLWDFFYSLQDYMKLGEPEKPVKNDVFVISTVPADDLAPWGAGPSAGSVMTKFRFYNISWYW